MIKKTSALMLLLLVSVVMTGCSLSPQSIEQKEMDTIWIDENVIQVDEDSVVESGDDDFFDSYSIDDQEHGTKTTVTVSDSTRSIKTNALPNHETWVFPNEENPNTISAQDNSYELPTEWEFKDTQGRSREPWIAVNGIKFEPETNERVECESWETYRIEAKQETFKVIGLDEQHAHVQPTGTYHYHGVSQELVDFADTAWNDLVHVGFAKDWFHMYYSKSGVYAPSYKLSNETREWTSCAYRWTDIDIAWTTPDGTYVSDWVFDEEMWDLDECNWIEVDGEYAYIVTDDYPYIGRCLNGDADEQRWPGWWAWWPPPGQNGERGGPPPRN